MSGAFSKQLLDPYQARARGPHTPYSTYRHDSISVDGPTSFNPTMHGTYHPQDAFSCTPNDSTFLNLSADTEMKLAALQAKLNQKLGPEYISTRPGGGGMKLTYTEGWKVINLANEVFGFNGWSTAVVNVTCDFADYDPNTQRYTIGIAAIVRVTLRDGVYHEDMGYGMMENSKSKAAAFDKCRKEAVTDALKRALRNFGNLLGNCLYDKEYTKEIQKIKAPPPPKLDKDSLHRRPEFAEQKPDPSLVKPTAGPSSIDRNGNHNHNPTHHHASTSNDRPAKLEPVTPKPPGPNTTVGNNRPAQPTTTTNTANTAWGAKNAPQQNNSRPTPNAGGTAAGVYRPPPPKNQPSNAPVIAPQQQPQQPVAKPNTTEPTTTSMDVDYMAGEDDFAFFGSEDEKWMMGDFDLDVDLGRPIDFEGEGLTTDQDDSGFQDAKSSGNADPQKGASSVPGPNVSASAQRTVTFSVPGRNNNADNSSLGSSVNGDNNSAQRSGGFNLADPASKGVVNPSRPANELNQNGNHVNKETNQRPLANVRSGGNGTSIGNGNNRGQPLNGSTGSGNGGRTNLPNSTSNVQPSGSGNNRPSAGGFTFPPGVNGSGSRPGSVPPNNAAGQNQNQTPNHNQNQSGIGSKRPAESMLQHPQQHPGGSGFKRVSTGMGLSAMPTNGNNRGNGNGNNGNTNSTTKREPLGNLFTAGEDAGGGGPDPKRMRR